MTTTRLEFLSLPKPGDRGRSMARNLYLDHVMIQELTEMYKGKQKKLTILTNVLVQNPKFWGSNAFLEGVQCYLYDKEDDAPQLVTVRVNYGHNTRWKNVYFRKGKKKTRKWRRDIKKNRAAKWASLHEDFLKDCTFRSTRFHSRSITRSRSRCKKNVIT